MDPDSEVAKAASKISPLVFLLFFFTACQSNKEDNSQTKKTTTQGSPALQIQKVDSAIRTGKTIYLTFDDGPNLGTGMVMKIASEEKIPITMFFIGTQLHGSPGQLASFRQAAHNPFIEIQNHSYTHAHNHFDRFYTSPSNVIADFAKAEDSLGLKAKIVRTPGRNIWRLPNIKFTDIKKSAAASDSLFNAGYTVVGWDVEWPFNGHLQLTKTTQQMLDKVDSFFSKRETRTPGHLILLAHDQSFADSTDATSLRSFMTQLKNSGKYNFEIISKYPKLKQ